MIRRSSTPDIGPRHGVCPSYNLGKQHHEPFPKHVDRHATTPLAVIHLDLCGPTPLLSLGGAAYFLLLLDDFSRFSWIYFLSHKDQDLSRFHTWHLMVEKESRHSVKLIRSNKGREFTFHDFDHHLEAHGIRRELANTGIPSENSIVKRKNRTSMEMARIMLAHDQLPQSLWGKAMMTAIHTLNHSPTSVILSMTPYQAYLGSKPDVSYFRVFGYNAYVHIPKKDCKKFSKWLFSNSAACQELCQTPI